MMHVKIGETRQHVLNTAAKKKKTSFPDPESLSLETVGNKQIMQGERNRSTTVFSPFVSLMHWQVGKPSDHIFNTVHSTPTHHIKTQFHNKRTEQA
jgi:hypothetical protein